jgi:hypothetical protein
MRAFKPGSTVSLSVSSSTASVALGSQAETVRIFNATAVTVFVRFGTDSATAALTDMPIPAGAVESFAPSRANFIAGITASGAGTIYVTVGEGV